MKILLKVLLLLCFVPVVGESYGDQFDVRVLACDSDTYNCDQGKSIFAKTVELPFRGSIPNPGGIGKTVSGATVTRKESDLGMNSIRIPLDEDGLTLEIEADGALTEDEIKRSIKGQRNNKNFPATEARINSFIRSARQNRIFLTFSRKAFAPLSRSEILYHSKEPGFYSRLVFSPNQDKHKFDILIWKHR